MNLIEKTATFGRAAGVLAMSILALSSGAQELQLPASLSLQLTPATLSGGENGKLRVTALRDTRIAAQPISFKIESDDPALVRFRATEGTIPETQNGIDVEFGTGSTPVAKTVRLRVAYGSKTTETSVTLVPALLSRASCTPSTLFGTKGNSVSCTAELKAPAPTGGILLYVGPLTVTPGSGVKTPDAFALANPAIPAGSRSGSVQISYNALINAFSAFDFSSRDFSLTFEAQNRHFDVVLALEPQESGRGWEPIPNRAIKAGFDLVPLRPASFSVQPSTISMSTEGTATFVLNAPAGSNESVTLRSGNPDGARVMAANGVCAAATTGNVEIPLVAGTATQTFKVCARPVTAPTNVELTIFMRSGDYRAPVTVNP